MLKLTLQHILLWAGIITVLVILYFCFPSKSSIEAFVDKDAFKSEPEYKSQVIKINNMYEPTAGSKRPVTDLIPKLTDMPEDQQILVNFQALSCRYPGYIGPMKEGYFDPDIGVKAAVDAGCRVFVLDIDYLNDCKSENGSYFPHLVVRDIQNKLRIKPSSNIPLCNTIRHSNLQIVCEKINFYAFANSTQSASDPVIIVLNFLRQPPGSYKSNVVLDYFSNVAKALSPFKDRLLTNELYGGAFYRHKQEGRLLINKITAYNGKVLIFNNANTAGFTEVPSYPPHEDLDFLTNLRLYYTQTKLGITENSSGSMFGILQTAEDYMYIPSDRKDQVVDETKLRWTICLSKDPSEPISKDIYEKITNTYGIHSAPIILFDDQNKFMFTDKTFKTYCFIPKPLALRYIKPPIVTPGEANPSMNARQGKLLAPTI